MSHHEHHDDEHEEHHILDNRTGLNVFLFLLLFTFVTVITAKFFYFGDLNFIVAMVIATAKAAAVMMYFMGLKYDTPINRLYFLSGFVFLGAFILLTAVDMWTRPADMRVKGPVLKLAAGSGPTFERPWEPTPELVQYGKKLYKDNACHTCHGEDGVNVLPQARNFTVAAAWKNGRRSSDIVYTLQKGIAPLMNSYPTLSTTDKLALSHYIHTFNSEAAPADDAESLARVGVDISKSDGGLSTGEAPRETVPVDFAQERYLSGQ